MLSITKTYFSGLIIETHSLQDTMAILIKTLLIATLLITLVNSTLHIYVLSTIIRKVIYN